MSQGTFFLSIIFFLEDALWGIVLSTMTCCWHQVVVNHIRSGSQQKAPGCFSIKYEGLDRRLQANQCRAAVECQEQEHFMGGSQHLPQGMSLHSCSAWSLQGERGEPWDCRMSAWQGGCFSVGCWHKRALPRENPHREKGKCVSFSPKLCMGQPRAVLLPGDGLGQPQGGGEALYTVVFSTWAHTHLPLPLLSACYPAAFLHPPGPADGQTTAGRKALEMGVSWAALGPTSPINLLFYLLSLAGRQCHSVQTEKLELLGGKKDTVTGLRNITHLVLRLLGRATSRAHSLRSHQRGNKRQQEY